MLTDTDVNSYLTNWWRPTTRWWLIPFCFHSVTVHDFPPQVRSALSGLEELDLSNLRYLSDLTFNRLTGCTPRLRRLSLAGCHIAFEFDPYRGCPVGAVEDSSALLSLRNLRRLLTEQRATLVALDLSRTSISPESLRTIAQVRIPEKFLHHPHSQ